MGRVLWRESLGGGKIGGPPRINAHPWMGARAGGCPGCCCRSRAVHVDNALVQVNVRWPALVTEAAALPDARAHRALGRRCMRNRGACAPLGRRGVAVCRPLALGERLLVGGEDSKGLLHLRLLPVPAQGRYPDPGVHQFVHQGLAAAAWGGRRSWANTGRLDHASRWLRHGVAALLGLTCTPPTPPSAQP